MPRYLTRSFQVVIDLVTLSVAYWLAFLFRFEFQIPKDYVDVALLNWGYAVAVQYGVLAALGVPQYSWRYVSLREFLRIGIALTIATLGLVALRLALSTIRQWDLFVIPLGVLASNFVLAFVGLTGVRATRRLQGEAKERKRREVSGTRQRASG